MTGTTTMPARFFEAVRAGDVAGVARMLEHEPALVGAHDAACFGGTALIHAVNRGDRAMADLLLDRGADPNATSQWWAGGFGPLDSSDDAMTDHLIARGATLTAHAAARLGRIAELRRLLEADPALANARGGDGQTPLHFARTPEIAGLLMDYGAELDARDIDHASTAAQYAARERPAVAAFLVSRGAEPDIFMASMIDDVVLLERLAGEPAALAARITPERFPAPGSEALGIYHYTVGTGCTLLHAAAAAGAARACRWLAGRGADPNARGGYDDGTPLHQAAWNNQVEAARALLDGGAKIDERSGHLHNNTPLGWAVVGGSVEMVELLLERGAALLGHIATDAEEGAAGKLRAFKPGLPRERWERVLEAVRAANRGSA